MAQTSVKLLEESIQATNTANIGNGSSSAKTLMIDALKKVNQHGWFTLKFLPIIIKWNGPLKQILQLDKIGSHARQTLAAGSAATMEVIGENAKKLLEHKNCVHTRNALATNNVDGLQKAICQDQTRIIQQMVMFEVISSGAIVLTQVFTLIAVWRELSRAENLTTESKEICKQLNGQMVTLQELVKEVQIEMLMFAQLIGYDHSNEEKSEFWSNIITMEAMASEMIKTKAKSQRDTERMLRKFQAKTNKCSRQYIDIQRKFCKY